MRRSRFSEEQIIGMIKEQESGMPTAEVCLASVEELTIDPSGFDGLVVEMRRQRRRPLLAGDVSTPGSL